MHTQPAVRSDIQAAVSTGTGLGNVRVEMLIDQSDNSQAVYSPLCDVRVSSNEKNDCTKAGGDISFSLVSQSQPIPVRSSRRYNKNCSSQINAECSFLYQVNCEF